MTRTVEHKCDECGKLARVETQGTAQPRGWWLIQAKRGDSDWQPQEHACSQVCCQAVANRAIELNGGFSATIQTRYYT